MYICIYIYTYTHMYVCNIHIICIFVLSLSCLSLVPSQLMATRTGKKLPRKGLAKAKGGGDHPGLWERIESLQAAIKEIELKHKSAQSAVREELNVLKVGRGGGSIAIHRNTN